MKATTVKLDGELLARIEESKPQGQSLSAYVRMVLQRNLDRTRVRDAAVEYRTFLASDPEEQRALDEWDRADLATPPRSKQDAS